MKPAIYAGHRITQQGLVIRSDSSEIVIPLVEASKLLSAVQRATKAMNTGGVGNDSGTITANGSGVLTAVGLTAGNSGLTTNSTGLANLAAKIQSVSGDTSGTMSILETFKGSLKIVIIEQSNYRQNGAAQVITLNTAFTFMCIIFNCGCGGIVQATGGSANNNNQITWGTGTSAGSVSSNTQIPGAAAGYSFGGFTQVGSAGGYASAHTGIGIYIGI